MSIQDLSKKDLISLEDQLKSLITQLSGGKWDDFSNTDLGYVFLKVLVSMIDMQNLTRDFQLNEVFLPTARERYSLQNILSLVGYKMRFATAGTIDLKVASDGDMVINKYATFIDQKTNTRGLVYFADDVSGNSKIINTKVINQELSVTEETNQELSVTEYKTKLTEEIDEVTEEIDEVTGLENYKEVVVGSVRGQGKFTVENESVDIQFKDELVVGSNLGDIKSVNAPTILGKIDYNTGTITWDLPPSSGTVNYLYYDKIKMRNGIGRTFTYPGSYVVYDNNLGYYKVVLGKFEYARNTMSFSIDSTVYTEVEDINFETGGEKVFSVHVTYDDNIEIRFKNKLLATSVLTVSFIETYSDIVGLKGLSFAPVYGVSGFNSSVKLIAESGVTGFRNHETVEEAKINGPLLSRTMGVAVTLKDYERIAMQAPGVLSAKAFDISSRYDVVFNDGDTEVIKIIPVSEVSAGVVTKPYQVVLLAVGENGPVTDEDAVNSYMNERRFLGIALYLNKYPVASGDPLPIRIYKAVISFKYNFYVSSPSLVGYLKEQIPLSIENYFGEKGLTLGQIIDKNDLVGYLYRNISELRGLKLVPSVEITDEDGNVISNEETMESLSDSTPANYMFVFGSAEYVEGM